MEFNPVVCIASAIIFCGRTNDGNILFFTVLWFVELWMYPFGWVWENFQSHYSKNKLQAVTATPDRSGIFWASQSLWRGWRLPLLFPCNRARGTSRRSEGIVGSHAQEKAQACCLRCDMSRVLLGLFIYFNPPQKQPLFFCSLSHWERVLDASVLSHHVLAYREYLIHQWTTYMCKDSVRA